MKILGHSRLSRKSQATIPKQVTKLLRLNTGDLLVFVKNGQRVLLKRGEVRVKD
jgi:AbrB family looped-hinge helix DNA binding protein